MKDMTPKNFHIRPLKGNRQRAEILWGTIHAKNQIGYFQITVLYLSILYSFRELRNATFMFQTGLCLLQITTLKDKSAYS